MKRCQKEMVKNEHLKCISTNLENAQYRTGDILSFQVHSAYPCPKIVNAFIHMPCTVMKM
jgi:hypothetical protein